MACMARRRDGQTNTTGSRLRVVPGTETPDEAALTELREQLAAAGVPAELLTALHSQTDPEELITGLVDAGVLPSPDDALTNLLSGWASLLGRGTTPLDAELSGAEFLGLMRATAPNINDLPAMLTDLVGQAEQTGSGEALAMLRVLASLGPEPMRPVASAAADRLVAAGLVDPPWVPRLGQPEVGACFGYRDNITGAQESLAVTFRYGRKEHALVVLIDHDLGGGIKDCFPTDQPDRVRADFHTAARRFGLTFADYPPDQAHEILTKALSAPPCPMAPDQVEDVRDYLELLRSRIVLLAEHTPTDGHSARSTAKTTMKATTKARPAKTAHRVKITLRGTKPPIWRRLEVPSTIKLDELHHAIQQAFGWASYHLWVFETPDGNYGAPDPELGHRDASRISLDRVASRAGDRLRYFYDFGDGWEHVIQVEDVLAAEPGMAYPRCVAGRRAGPPEDCGGVWGYAELLDILADPHHEEHADRLEWLDLDSATDFDPAAFDRDHINETLAATATILAKP